MEDLSPPSGEANWINRSTDNQEEDEVVYFQEDVDSINVSAVRATRTELHCFNGRYLMHVDAEVGGHSIPCLVNT